MKTDKLFLAQFICDECNGEFWVLTKRDTWRKLKNLQKKLACPFGCASGEVFMSREMRLLHKQRYRMTPGKGIMKWKE